MRKTTPTAPLLALSLSLAFCLFAFAADGVPESVSRAAELFEAGDDEAAAEILAAAAAPDRPWADYYLGRIELRRGELDAAIERLGAAVAAQPASPLFQRWLGEAYVAKIDKVNAFAKLGLAKKAKDHFEEAVRLAPSDFDARDALVGFYLNAPPIAGGSKEKAAEQVAELKALDPPAGHALQGRIHFNDGEWPQAEAAYRAALEDSPDDAGYHYLLGFSRQQQEKYDEATADFETAVRLDPDSTAPYYQIGRTAVFSGRNLDRGIECLELYLDREPRRGEPGHQHAWWRLGMLYALRGEKDRAAAAYRAALEIDPEHEEAGKALAELGG